eukprot:SAG11_NODE_1112_length_5821_cov_43.477281_7_plen_143_part_00
MTRKKSVMAELRAAAKTVGHAAVSSRPQSPAAASAISIEAASLQSVGISNVVTTAAASAPTFDGTIAASVADADSDGGPSTHSSAPQVDGLEHIIPQLVVTEAVHHVRNCSFCAFVPTAIAVLFLKENVAYADRAREEQVDA